MEYIEITNILFSGKQNIQWNDVEDYLRKFDAIEIVNHQYGDIIKLNALFADEYTHSNYTKKLRGGLAKAKANLVQIIPVIIANATNRRWVENKDDKHKENAIKGWYRYDVCFSMQVFDPSQNSYRNNNYSATAVVRINDKGNYLHDIINIKKEARRPTDH